MWTIYYILRHTGRQDSTWQDTKPYSHFSSSFWEVVIATDTLEILWWTGDQSDHNPIQWVISVKES